MIYYLTYCQFPIPFNKNEQEDLWEKQVYNETEKIVSNSKIQKVYLELAKELNIIDSKHPDDIYKEHLINVKTINENIFYGQKDIASIYVNAFINCGFQNDQFINFSNNKSELLKKYKKNSIIAAIASLGMISFWNYDGVNILENYKSNENKYLKAGICLGQGILCAGSHKDNMIEIFKTQSKCENNEVKIATILGLGFAYCGKALSNCKEELLVYLKSKQSLAIYVSVIISLGLIFISTKDNEIITTVIENIKRISTEELEKMEIIYFLLYV
jgi:26S proteasome regulatory subunit N1